MGAKLRAKGAREAAQKGVREKEGIEAEADARLKLRYPRGGLGLVRHMRPSEVHEVRKRWVGRPTPELARRHQFQ
jgi:hypothetical protein